MGLGQGSSNSARLPFGARYFLWWGRPVHCRVLSSIPGFDQKHTYHQFLTTRNAFRYCQMSPRSKTTPVEKHWRKERNRTFSKWKIKEERSRSRNNPNTGTFQVRLRGRWHGGGQWQTMKLERGAWLVWESLGYLTRKCGLYLIGNGETWKVIKQGSDMIRLTILNNHSVRDVEAGRAVRRLPQWSKQERTCTDTKRNITVQGYHQREMSPGKICQVLQEFGGRLCSNNG